MSDTNTKMLDELIKQKASTLSPSEFSSLIQGLRTQREQWNKLQSQESEKRAPSSKIPTEGERRSPSDLEGLEGFARPKD